MDNDDINKEEFAVEHQASNGKKKKLGQSS